MPLPKHGCAQIVEKAYGILRPPGVSALEEGKPEMKPSIEQGADGQNLRRDRFT